MASSYQLFEWLTDIGDSSWKSEAACKGMGPDIFFGKRTKQAKKICDTCHVRVECAQYHEEFENMINWRSGVYGGTTVSERNAVAAIENENDGQTG